METKRMNVPGEQITNADLPNEAEQEADYADSLWFADEDPADADIDEADEEDEDDWEEEYVSESEIARENGFWVDDDGHWREMEDDDDWC